MAIENYGLREAVLAATDDAITVHLHTGDPGSAGTSSRVPTGTLGSVTIAAATAGWTINSTTGRAQASADLEYGNAGAAVTGVSWISMFKGVNFYARRALAAAMNIANGAPVTLTGSTVVIEFTSTD